MSKKTHNFKVGQRVEFRPTHQKDMKRTGWVADVSDYHNVLDVQLEPGSGEVTRVYQADAADCALAAEQTKDPFSKKRNATEDREDATADKEDKQSTVSTSVPVRKISY